MHKEETTLSEDLMNPSWREWVKDNKLFLITIGSLSFLSICLMIQNYSATSASHASPISIQEPQVFGPSTVSKSKPRIQKDPLSKAKELFQESKMKEALTYLLQLSHEHPDMGVRKKASALAKEYRLIQLKREETKRTYLQGYVLFQTYPEKACEEWSNALRSKDEEDPYYEKAKKRFQENCISK